MKHNICHLLHPSLALPMGLMLVFCCLPSVIAVAKEKNKNPSVVEMQKNIIKADVHSLKMALNGIVSPNAWEIDASIKPDILTTTAGAVTFMSGIDTLTVNLEEWSHKDITPTARPCARYLPAASTHL